MGVAGTWIAIALLTVFHFWCAATLPPTPDELYYWNWSQKLLPSYFDHPPMVAYAIRLSTALFGDSILAIRLPAIVFSLVVFLILLRLAHRGILVWLLLLSPLALYGSVLMTPDLPLAFFWILYAVWLAQVNTLLDAWSQDPVTRVYHSSPVPWVLWILGGVLLGFGGLSKYTMALAVPCAFLALATRTRWRAWGPGFALHLLVAGLLTLPVSLYFFRQDFAPFLFQWTHAMRSDGFSLWRSLEFLAGQTALIGLLPLFMLPWILLRARDVCAEPRSQVYFWFFVLPYVFFLYRSLRVKLEGNWAVVAYLTFWPVADRLLSWSSFRTFVRGMVGTGFLVPVAASIALLVHLFHPFSALKPRYDRVAVLRSQWDMAQLVASYLKDKPLAGPLWVSDYQWTSYMRYLGIGAEQLFPGHRPSQYTPAPQDACASAEVLALQTWDNHAPALQCFSKKEQKESFAIVARGKEVGRLWLFRYTK